MILKPMPEEQKNYNPNIWLRTSREGLYFSAILKKKLYKPIIFDLNDDIENKSIKIILDDDGFQFNYSKQNIIYSTGLVWDITKYFGYNYNELIKIYFNEDLESVKIEKWINN